MYKRDILKGLLIGGIIVLAALSRVIPHPWNFTPMIAILIFSAANFKNPYLKVALPALVILLSDVILQINNNTGFHSGTPVVYLSYIAVAVFSFFSLKQISIIKVLVTSILSSLIFFAITNFAFFYPASPTVNLALGTYPHNLEGILASYTSALPFFRNAFFGDLLFTGILFGTYALTNVFLLKNKPSTSI